MDLTEKNGQPSMEEVLASIRRIIAEEPDGPNQIIDLSRPSLVGDGLLEDAADFELPSIFRPAAAPAATEKNSPLFGRLTDAIRGASGGVPADLKPAEPEYRNGSGIDEPVHALHPMARSAYEASIQQTDGLSSLKSTRADYGPAADIGGSSHFTNMSAGPEDSPAAPVDVPRMMAPFKDSKFHEAGNGDIAASRGNCARACPAGRRPARRFFDDRACATGSTGLRFGAAGASRHRRSRCVSAAASGLGSSSNPAASQTVPLGAAPPTRASTAASEAGAAPVGSVDDTTADLLRPMLRQWLADNMPRMVEKALHIEVAESVKSTKKGDVG